MNMTSNTMTTGTIHELGELFNTVITSWHRHPNHFGHPSFDEFLKSMPTLYYGLVQFHQQMAQIQQNQLQMAAAAQLQAVADQLEIETNSSISSDETDSDKCHKLKVTVDEQSVDLHGNNSENNNNNHEMNISPADDDKADIDDGDANGHEEVDEENKENPFSLLPPYIKQRRYRRSAAVCTLDVIEENKCTPSTSPSLSPLPPIPSNSPNASPCPAQTVRAKLNASAAVFRPCVNDKKYEMLQEFVPRHSARAKLNIYIPKHMTKTLLAAISEHFPNTNTLYYYLDISTALQINDHQLHIIQVQMNGNENHDGDAKLKQIVLINYDLHAKHSGQPLFAVVTANDAHKVEVNTAKWLWKIEEFLTEQQIVEKYDIHSDDLPKSSRLMQRGLYAQLKQQMANIDGINEPRLLREFKWTLNDIKQIGSSQKAKKGRKLMEATATLTQREWLNACQYSWNYLPAIPIIVYENRDINAHWLEWVKMIYVESQQCFVGLSFRFNDQSNTWQVESICLDKGDIQNKHRLLNLQSNAEHFAAFGGCTFDDEYFAKFSTRITEIQWE